MTEIKIVNNPSRYNIPLHGHPNLHRNLAWFATDDDELVGVVILDLVDRDYSWVVLAKDAQTSAYAGVDLNHSLSTQEAATEQLHAAMRNRIGGGKPNFGPEDMAKIVEKSGKTAEELRDIANEVADKWKPNE